MNIKQQSFLYRIEQYNCYKIYKSYKATNKQKLISVYYLYQY